MQAGLSEEEQSKYVLGKDGEGKGAVTCVIHLKINNHLTR